MSFIVINSVRADPQQIPDVLDDVQRLGLDAARGQPGFRSARLLVAEDGREAALIVEWESREAFMSYRRSETGRSMIGVAAALHPHIAFYEVIAGVDSTVG